MKIFVFIISIFVLGLAAIPCTDIFIDKTNTETISTIDRAHSSTQDYCSPFCACQCCQVQVTEFNNVIIEKPIKNKISTAYFTYDNQAGEEVYQTLFKPPRVV